MRANEIKNAVFAAIAAAGSAVAQALGGWDTALAVLVALFGRPWWLAAYAALAALVLALEFLPWAAADRRRGERRLRHYGLSWK